ncbi:hypothetical protein [Cryobacterium sp. Y29]|uniref:hypothetical protein n=1 Tax=Cryobacterium sp. Y29 TaxID=2048285 RepID=UPI0011B0594B|nr:hypothetical protein [Cryobacterium sp. Y29]
MDALAIESVERILDLERRLDLARDRLVAEVVSAISMCTEFAEVQAGMEAEIGVLRRQRGAYWRIQSRLGRVLPRVENGARRRGFISNATDVMLLSYRESVSVSVVSLAATFELLMAIRRAPSSEYLRLESRISFLHSETNRLSNDLPRKRSAVP